MSCNGDETRTMRFKVNTLKTTRKHGCLIEESNKYHNAPFPYPTMHQSKEKYAHFYCEWCIVWYWMRYVRLVYGIFVCKGNHMKFQLCVGNSTYFDCKQLFLMQSKHYEEENSTTLMGLKSTTSRLHAGRSGRWATGIWYFPIQKFIVAIVRLVYGK